MPGNLNRPVGASVLAIGVLAGLLILDGTEAAAQTVVELNGAAALNYTRTTAELAEKTDQFLLDLRPQITIQKSGARVTGRLGYLFSGLLELDGSGATYSNALDLALVTQLNPRLTMTLGANAAQGGTAFRVSQGSAATGQPQLRAESDRNLLNGGLNESLLYDMSPAVKVDQALGVTFSSPLEELERYGATANASLGVTRFGPVNALGLELDSSVSQLAALEGEVDHYVSISNGLSGRWSRDLGRRWTGSLEAGVQGVQTFRNDQPFHVLPTASLNLGYVQDRLGGGILLSRGSTTNVETGTVGVTDFASIRGSYNLDPTRSRALAASAGILHTSALGDDDQGPAAVAGIGNALQADLSFNWDFTESFVGNIRYSLAYQFAQPGDLEPSLVQVVFIGVSARYRNARFMAPLPSLGGQRVDGGDGVGFGDKIPAQ